MKLYKSCIISASAIDGASRSEAYKLAATAGVMTALDMLDAGCQGISVVGLQRKGDGSVEIMFEGECDPDKTPKALVVPVGQ